MIEWIEFKNFKALRDAKLPLSRFTLIVGANGSGKSTALSGISALGHAGNFYGHHIRTAGVPKIDPVTLTARWHGQKNEFQIQSIWDPDDNGPRFRQIDGRQPVEPLEPRMALQRARVFSLDAEAIAQPVFLQPTVELARNGTSLAGVLDRLRDQNPERFEALNQELMRWIPEFDRILFETPQQGHR